MRHIEAPWREWEATAPGEQPENGNGAADGADAADDADAAATDADARGPGAADDTPLWSTADDHVLHLPPQSIEQIIVGGAPRPGRPRQVPRPRRRRVIQAVGRLVRNARRIGPRAGVRMRPPVFRSRAGGRTFRITTRPRAGWRNEIVSIESETAGGPLLESELDELLELESEGEGEITVPPPAAFDPKEFVPRLGKEWSERRGGTPAAGPMTTWLFKDLADTLAGARLRWTKGQFTEAVIARGWAISRVENMRFQLASWAGLRSLGNMAPPKTPVTLTSNPIVKHSDVAPVAPLTIRFVQELKKRYTKSFSAQNYRGHGGGPFLNRGFSLDLYISGTDSRGFYPASEAIAFMRAVHQAAAAAGAEWRVLYNDFSVADVINRETKAQHILFMGVARYKDAAKTKVAGLNWHGPHPLILHFHIDLAPAQGRGGTVSREAPAPPPGAKAPSVDREVAAALRIAKRAVPGMSGKTIEALVEEWRLKICPEIPLPILLAFIRYESGGNFDDATHGTAKNGWTVPAFYELGLFQTPAGLHGRCSGPKPESCQFGPPGQEGKTPSTWVRLCKQIGADPRTWKNPVTQVRVGLMDLESAAARLRKDYPDLFTTRGSDWDLRMAVLYTFSRGGGYARSFLRPYRQQLLALPESSRWRFLQDKVVTITGTGGQKIRRAFLGDNVEKKMVLAGKLGYKPR
jgi:hypothetical protein